MSAFVCSEQHIGALARYMAEADRPWDEAFARTFRLLMDENIASVCHRYHDDDPSEYAYVVTEDTYNASPVLTDPVQVLGLCNCLEYQSCEDADAYYDSPAWAMLNRIRCKAIDQLPGVHDHWAI